MNKERTANLMENSKAKEVSYIGISVALIIAGGLGIFFTSQIFAVPGFKYILMAPYLSLIITAIYEVTSIKWTTLKINLIFGMIMGIINIYMGIAILTTGIGTELVRKYIGSYLFKSKEKLNIFTGVVYSAFTVLSAFVLGISLMLTEAYIDVSWLWVFMATIITGIFGLPGGILGSRLGKRIYRARS